MDTQVHRQTHSDTQTRTRVDSDSRKRDGGSQDQDRVSIKTQKQEAKKTFETKWMARRVVKMRGRMGVQVLHPSIAAMGHQ